MQLSYTFDASITAMLLPLLSGKAVVLSSRSGLEVFEDANLQKYAPYDFINITPAHLELLEGKLSTVKGALLTPKLVIGGEALLPRHFSNIIAQGLDIEIINLYGPTEATIGCTTYSFHPVREADKLSNSSIPIGKPIDNTKLYILNSDGQLAPIGVTGEMYIGGAQVARGYLNQPELTAERFVKDPFSADKGARMYKSGDLAKWLPDGNVVYQGRADDQVKIRGYRIELGEIESVLAQSSLVRQGVVLAKESKGGEKRLLSYYVPDWQAVKAEEKAHYQRQVDAWKDIYETEYSETAEATGVDEEFDIRGWNDSFTGGAIPAEQMQQWLDDIIKVILAEDAGRVLEIGSGSGMIFYKLAGKIEKYLGTDLSSSAVTLINTRIAKGLREYGPAKLWASPAHEVNLPEGEDKVDTIVLNSIVQYFPGEDYMDQVLKRSMDMLSENGGRIIVGDVRDNRLLEAFRLRLQMQKLQSTASLQEVDWALNQAVLKEEELCLSPGYFYDLQIKYPQISYIDIQWKQGDFTNELSLYRYNVVLYINREKPLIAPEWQNWSVSIYQSILVQLARGEASIALKDAPNPRLWKEKQLLEYMGHNQEGTLADLTTAAAQEGEATRYVQLLLTEAEAKGYHYRLMLNKDAFKVNILFERNGTLSFVNNITANSKDNQLVPNANIPLFKDISAALRKDIRALLQAQLPDYMVPQDITAISQMPLNSSGKIDRNFLTKREDVAFSSRLNYQAPATALEQLLANIWQELLGVEQAGVNDNFFELGGDSILTIQLVSRIRRLGYELQPKDIFLNQTIAQLSQSIVLESGARIIGEQGKLNGSFGLIPIQEWYLEKDPADVSHFNQSLLLQIDKSISAEVLQSALNQLVLQHDALRLQYKFESGQWEQTYGSRQVQLDMEDIRLTDNYILANQVTQLAENYQRSLSITDGLLMRMVLMKTPVSEGANRLLMVIHHLVIDGVSWRILLDDLNLLISGLINSENVSLGVKGSSYRQWQQSLANYSEIRNLTSQSKYWEQTVKGYVPLPDDNAYKGKALVKDMRDYKVKLEQEQTRYLLQEVPKAYQTEINDILLSALSATLCQWAGREEVVIGLEGHGREDISAEIDISQTVGWFTSLYPVLLKQGVDTGTLIKGVKEDLRRIPDKGIGYGVLKYITKSASLQGDDPWDIVFNYLGQLDTVVGSDSWVKGAPESGGTMISESQFAGSKLSVNGVVSGGELSVRWNYSSKHYTEQTIRQVATAFIKQLLRIIGHCMDQGKTGDVIHTPADYGLGAEITYQELDRFLDDDEDDIISF